MTKHRVHERNNTHRSGKPKLCWKGPAHICCQGVFCSRPNATVAAFAEQDCSEAHVQRSRYLTRKCWANRKKTTGWTLQNTALGTEWSQIGRLRDTKRLNWLYGLALRTRARSTQHANMTQLTSSQPSQLRPRDFHDDEFAHTPSSKWRPQLASGFTNAR